MRFVDIEVRSGLFAGLFVFAYWNLGESNAREVEEEMKNTAIDYIANSDYVTEAVLNSESAVVAEALHFHFCDGLGPNEGNIVYLSMNCQCSRED